MTDSELEYERLLHEQLRMIRESYEKDAAPIIKRLVNIYAMRPAPPMILRVDQLDPAFLKKLFLFFFYWQTANQLPKIIPFTGNNTIFLHNT